MMEISRLSWHDFLTLIIQTLIMDNNNGENTSKKTRKDFRRMVASRIETALQDLQSGTKEKKFKAAVKRASKLLANDLYDKNKKGKNTKEEVSPTVEAEAIGA